MEGMHDLAFFRNNFDRIAERLATRGNAPALDRFRELDQKRRAAIRQAEDLKSRRNRETAEISKQPLHLAAAVRGEQLIPQRRVVDFRFDTAHGRPEEGEAGHQRGLGHRQIQRDATTQ